MITENNEQVAGDDLISDVEDSVQVTESHLSEHAKRKARLALIRIGKISREYLMSLIMNYKAKKDLWDEYPVPRELGEVFQIIVEKNIGAPRWRRYSPDWKDDMRTRAISHLLRYSHNFDPYKCETGKNDDPYNYFAMIANMAFTQTLNKCKIYAENNVLMNPEVIYNENSWGGENQDRVADITQNTPNIDAIDWGGF